MAALNITLILWAVIVTAMTVILSVKLFRQEERRSHCHAPDDLLKIRKEPMISNNDSKML